MSHAHSPLAPVLALPSPTQVGDTQPLDHSASTSLAAADLSPLIPPGPKPYHLDKAEPLPISDFPNKPQLGQRGVPTTIANAAHVLRQYGVTVQYDVIAKRLRLDVPGVQLSAESNEAAMVEVVSLCVLNGLQIGPLREYIAAIGERNRVNPAADWIKSKPWDGADHFTALLQAITPAPGYPEDLLRLLLRRWLISVVAAALSENGFRSRGVLTLQGPQGIGKTAFLARLLPASLVKIDHHLDPSNKDSLLGAVATLVTEIGELDSSMRKDVARLKGFLTAPYDRVRRPYGRDEVNYPRRTVFAATVNDRSFLQDNTGNSRWWTVEVTALDHHHTVDTQQVFAQLAEAFFAGERWWLSEEEEQLLDAQNRSYLAASVVRDRLEAFLSWQEGRNTEDRQMTATEVLEMIGFKNPGNAQVREAVPIFSERFGPRKKVRGKEGWKVPFSAEFTSV